MTLLGIKEAALRHFTQRGFEGASLAHIADEVGIKKQSIYSHFKGKDDLFLHVCRDVFDDELKTVSVFIESNATRPAEEFLSHFLLHYKERYEKSDHTKFWLRNSFFPPAHLYDQVMSYVYEYLDQVEELLIPVMEQAIQRGEVNPQIGAQRAVTAFLGVLDGILVEMLYGGADRLAKRLDASWHVYWSGLSKG